MHTNPVTTTMVRQFSRLRERLHTVVEPRTGPRRQSNQNNNGRNFVRYGFVMKTLFLALLISILALVAFACSDDDANPSEPTTPTNPPVETPTSEPPTETPTAEPEEGEAPEGLYGHGKRTGIPEIDAVLDAWEPGDIDALSALALLQEMECVTEVQGLGGPPECPPGVDDGTTVQVMGAAACEGFWVYEDGLGQLFQTFVDGFDGAPYYLYAAWRADADQHLPAGFRIQFARSVADGDIFSPQVVLDEAGRIYYYLGGCSPAAPQVPVGADFVLEPKLGAPTGTGIPAVDRFLTIREQQNVTALVNLVTFIEVACKLPSEADYWVLCPAGRPSGTMVPAFPWWGCHGAYSNAGTRDQIAEFFATWDGELKSVLRFAPSGSVDMFPAHASLAVVFERADTFAWAAILDDDGNFYGVVTGCPATAEELRGLHFAGSDAVYRQN